MELPAGCWRCRLASGRKTHLERLRMLREQFHRSSKSSQTLRQLRFQGAFVYQLYCRRFNSFGPNKVEKSRELAGWARVEAKMDQMASGGQASAVGPAESNLSQL